MESETNIGLIIMGSLMISMIIRVIIDEFKNK